MDWLICQNGRGARKEILLAQDQKSFLVIDSDAGLTFDKRNRLELEGVSEELLKRLDVPYEAIPKSSIRGIAIGGYAAGDAVYLYPKSGGRRKFQLRVNHEKDQINGFFADMQCFTAPVDKKEKKNNAEYWRREGRDQKTYESLGIIIPIMTVFSFLTAILYGRTGAWYWFIGCLLCVVLPPILVILFPQYFTLIMAAKGKKSDALEASWIFFGVAFILIIMPARNWVDQRLFWIAMLLCGIAGVLLLGLLAEEFRRKKEYLFGVFFFAAVIGATLVGHANEVFDFHEPVSYILEVEDLDYWRGGRRNRTKHYECVVTLPDGREAKMNIDKETYDVLEIGGPVRVVVGSGAFGIEYANAFPLE